MGLASNLRDYLAMASQLQHAVAHSQRAVPIREVQSGFASREAFVKAPDGVSEVAYPSVGAFCRAQRMKGEAERTVSDQDLLDKESAIDLSVNARYVSAGDLVEVYRDAQTTCSGQLWRLPEHVSLIRDMRSGVSGWVFSRGLSSAMPS